jgi:membrane protease YdiL (CAAX protease family)
MDEDARSSRPWWRKVWEFPLVAMVVAVGSIALVAYAIGAALAGLPRVVGAQTSVAVVALATVAAVFALYKLVIRRLGRVKRDDLPLRPALRELGLGVAFGGSLMAVVVGIAGLFGVYRIVGPGGLGDAVYILFGGGLVAGFVEEVLFRGVIFRWLEETFGSWAALALTSALFGLAHLSNDNATPFSSFAIAMEAGILLGACYMVTRNLWLAIGVHFAWNVMQGLVFDVPVSGHEVEGLVEARLSGPELLSGGAFGLEASLIAVIVCTTAGVWLAYRAWKAGRTFPPLWVNR